MMDIIERTNTLRVWSKASPEKKAAYFAAISGRAGGPAPETVPEYTKCMDKCADKHMRLIKKCEKLTGAALEACAKGVEEQMADCYQRCNDML
jgi:hypothetical protein